MFLDVVIIVLLLALLGSVLAFASRALSAAGARGELETLKIENARLLVQLENERTRSAEKIALLESAEDRLKLEFSNLAQRIFEERGRAVGEQNRERIESLLKPFREQLERFRRRVDEVHTENTARGERLIEQVRQLQELSNRVSDEANHLASAIKGDSKSQGDWGELVIERIFEASGLERGREFEVQESMRDAEGQLKRPDFTVFLPGGKAVFVDSKVSLKAYEQFSHAETDDERSTALAGHLASVRKHVKELQDKNYEALLGNRSLDFVLMCIPLEPAFQCALQNDPGLIEDLARSRVVISGPVTLMITLKLIAQIWRREHENKNAEIIAERAGRLYDQVSLIADAVSDARKRLRGVDEAFDLVEKRMASGRGNLIARVEELRRLGAKTNRPIATDLQTLALESFDEPDEREP